MRDPNVLDYVRPGAGEPRSRRRWLWPTLLLAAAVLILTVSLWPSFTRVRTPARESVRYSQLNQLVGGLMRYVADHGGRYPDQPAPVLGRYLDPAGSPFQCRCHPTCTAKYVYVGRGATWTDAPPRPVLIDAHSLATASGMTRVLYSDGLTRDVPAATAAMLPSQP